MPTHEVDVLDDGGAASIRSWFLGQMALGQADTGTMRLQRKAENIRRNQIDHYAFGVNTAGSWNGDASGRDLSVAEDGVFVMDMARPMHVVLADTQCVQVVIPRDLLDSVVPPRDLHGLVLRGGMCGLFHEYIVSLTRRLPDVSAADSPEIVRATLALLAAVLRPTPDALAEAAPVVDTLLLARARRYIERHLRDPDLDPGAVCRALRVSRSRLYGWFEPFGGVAIYIQHRRLAKIYTTLAQGSDPRLVSEIAAGFGFIHAEHFSRAFRARYGITPRDLRRFASAPMVLGADGLPVAEGAIISWLRRPIRRYRDPDRGTRKTVGSVSEPLSITPAREVMGSAPLTHPVSPDEVWASGPAIHRSVSAPYRQEEMARSLLLETAPVGWAGPAVGRAGQRRRHVLHLEHAQVSGELRSVGRVQQRGTGTSVAGAVQLIANIQSFSDSRGVSAGANTADAGRQAVGGEGVERRVIDRYGCVHCRLRATDDDSPVVSQRLQSVGALRMNGRDAAGDGGRNGQHGHNGTTHCPVSCSGSRPIRDLSCKDDFCLGGGAQAS